MRNVLFHKASLFPIIAILRYINISLFLFQNDISMAFLWKITLNQFQDKLWGRSFAGRNNLSKFARFASQLEKLEIFQSFMILIIISASQGQIVSFV